MKEHSYQTTIQWTGNKGNGTNHYTAYERSHEISVPNKLAIEASSDPSFRGDATKYNPEELLVASLSSCHMLWYLHLCAVNNVVVTAYKDNARGIMIEEHNGSGQFKEVTLYPQVTVQSATMVDKAKALHEKANQHCFIANSVNFPVKHIPQIRIANNESF